MRLAQRLIAAFGRFRHHRPKHGSCLLTQRQIRIFIVLLTLILTGFSAKASSMGSCLALAEAKVHRLDRLDEVKNCLTRYATTLSKNDCHSLVEEKSSDWSSIKLTEEAHSLCFYETSAEKDIRSCLRYTKKLQDASRHDEAVFFCYQQFQEKLNLDDCLYVARQMIYPVKTDYLKQHCLQKN